MLGFLGESSLAFSKLLVGKQHPDGHWEPPEGGGNFVKGSFAGKYKDRGWQYPYAHERNGKLYVIYSVGKEDCEMAIIPLTALRVD